MCCFVVVFFQISGMIHPANISLMDMSLKTVLPDPHCGNISPIGEASFSQIGGHANKNSFQTITMNI